jgi:hypothetical protein
MSSDGYLYVFRDMLNSNIIKVGFSKNPFNRIKQLYNTSTAIPLGIRQIWWVGNMRRAERIAHYRLEYHRINPRREFFEIAPRQDFNEFERMDYDITSTCLDVLIELIEDDFYMYSMEYLSVDIQKLYEMHLNGELN